MALSVTHTTVATTPDDPNYEIGSDEWNAAHTVSGQLAISTDISGLGAGIAAFLATPSSANLATAVTDETGSGALVFGTSPTLVTPVVTTTIDPSSDDGAALGESGTAWSDLFLASGGVINWNAGDVTITHSSNLLTFGGGNLHFGSGYVDMTEQAAPASPAANDGRLYVADNSGTTTLYFKDSAGTATNLLSGSSPVGLHMVPVTALAMTPNTTNGADSGITETTTNANMYSTLDFDPDTDESAQFIFPMPESWNEGTVTFQPIWSHSIATGDADVVWQLAGVAMSDDDTWDVAFGTAQTSTDTGGIADDVYIGPESSAITIGGTPAAGDLVLFKITRNASSGSDTLPEDARLLGIRLYITTDAATD